MDEPDFPNILTVIISKENENLYKLSSKHGILNLFYTRNDFTVCKKPYFQLMNFQ